MGDERLVEIEAALQVRWDDATAAVYADALIARGDPRGELITLDLHIARHGRSDKKLRRRKALARAWLGEEAGAYDGFGFTSGVATSIQGAAGFARRPYLRAVTLYDHEAPLEAIVHALADAPLPWLRRLTLIRGERPQIPSVALSVLAAAAPHLEELALDGRLQGDGVCDAPLPSSIHTLRLTGCCAVLGDAAIEEVTEIDLNLLPEMFIRGDLPPLTQLVATQLGRFPALARLDIARNEYPYRVEDPDDYSMFPLLRAVAKFGALSRIRWLRTPALRSDTDLEVSLGLLEQHPTLELHIARTYDYVPPITHPRLHVPTARPWPSQREVPVRSGLLITPVDLGDSYIALFDCIDALEGQFDAWSATEQDAWRRLWRFLDGLEWGEDCLNAPELPFDAATLLVALDALDDKWGICTRFADGLRALSLPPRAMVGVRRCWSG